MFHSTTKKMHINPNAPVVQSNEIFIDATPERVWAVLTNISAWPQWYGRISRAHIDATPAQGVPFQWKINGAAIQSVLQVVVPHQTFGWSGVTFGGSAIHRWQLTPASGGTLVQVAESMDGWLIRLFKSKMNRDLAADMVRWLAALKEECENR
jgi:uncharacterized protein YndB with AHSA1/START domain